MIPWLPEVFLGLFLCQLCLYCDQHEKLLEQSAICFIAPSQWQASLDLSSPESELECWLAPNDLPKFFLSNRHSDWFLRIENRSLWNVPNNELVAWWHDDHGYWSWSLFARCKDYERSTRSGQSHGKNSLKGSTVLATFKAPSKGMELQILSTARMFWQFCQQDSGNHYFN